MNSNSTILITGAGGMVGRALQRVPGPFSGSRSVKVIGALRSDCDFEDREATLAYFEKIRPDYVFHLAAKVGGIKANMSDPVGFLTANALINCHVLEACHKVAVKKTLVLGSSCVYPRMCPQPMKEEYLLTGPIEPTNEGYGLGKILGIKLAKYYHDQYGMKVVCPCPSNIYGPGDTFDLERSHVLSALVRRFVEARDGGKPSLTLWGTGSARREFIHVDDVARAMIFFMEKVETPDMVNLGTGTDVTIRELAELVARLTGYKGRIEWDSSKPDGMPRKCVDITRLKALGFEARIQLEQGVAAVIKEFEELR